MKEDFLSDYCSIHPQVKLDLFCKQCGMDMCRECTCTREHECTASSDRIHEETQGMEETTIGMVQFLEEMKEAISRAKQMKQSVKNRMDYDINVAKEVFTTLRKIIDEKEEKTVADIKEAAHMREKALEVSLYCSN